jgi:hypothetical protein
MPDTTLLVLSGFGVPPYSARGLTQTLDPIAGAAVLRRTVNGDLVDRSAPQFRKYQSSISCADQQAPALEGIWPGQAVTVDCVAELAYLTMTDAPSRPVVEDSSREEGDFTFYRPRLTMRVVGFSQSRDEYGAVTSWKLDLEEV